MCSYVLATRKKKGHLAGDTQAKRKPSVGVFIMKIAYHICGEEIGIQSISCSVTGITDTHSATRFTCFASETHPTKKSLLENIPR